MIKASDIGLEKADYNQDFVFPLHSVLQAHRDYENRLIFDLVKKVKCPCCKTLGKWRFETEWGKEIPQVTCCNCYKSVEINENTGIILSELSKGYIKYRGSFMKHGTDSDNGMCRFYEKRFINYLQDLVNALHE